MTHHFQVITKNLPTKFYRETLNKPWMRLQIFLDDGPLSRTPEQYKKFIYDWKVKTPTPVHYIPVPGKWEKAKDGPGKFDKAKDGLIIPVQNYPIPLKYPHQLDDGLWGGEAVIKGFIQRKPKNDPVPHYWIPPLHETVVQSEILDKYMKVMVTPRALDLIDRHYGLDSYLLETSSADLQSELALKLKRELLYVLLQKTLYPDDPVKREEIYEKYKKFIILEEELEWFGLTLSEANRKQMKLEAEAARTGPYKVIFRNEFIEYLKKQSAEAALAESEEASKKGILSNLSKFNVFSRSSK